MRKIVYIILIFTFLFLINIWFYFYNDNYYFFIKNIKYWVNLIDKESLNVTDNYIVENQTCNCDNIKQICDYNWKIIEENTNTINSWSIINNSKIDEFFTYFDKNTLKKKQYNEYYKIFDITDEYHTEYITYYNDNIEIYLFINSEFDDIFSMFELLSNDKSITNKYSLNKLNNFGKQSFFINTINDDWKIRLIIDSWKILFWLYTKKNYYYNIKTILKRI